MSPGQRVRVNDNCPWPERVGCEGIIVDPSIFGGVYPADARGNGERIIVLLDHDPLKNHAWSAKEPRWSCVMSARDLTSLVQQSETDSGGE